MSSRLILAQAALFFWAIVGEISHAGYEKATRSSAPSPEPSVGAWSALVARDKGPPVPLLYLGDRFASLDLEPLEVCRISLHIPGLRAGAAVALASTHGGWIEGQSHAVLKATENGRISFVYQVGRYGAHPLKVTARGRTVTLLFRVQGRMPDLEPLKAEVQP